MLQQLKANTMNRTEAEEWLIREAQLIDERQLDEWLQLFTEDGIYWVPIYADKGPNEATSIIYDTSVRREERVFRLLHTVAPVEDPPHRTLHAISNVIVRNNSDTELQLHSNQVIYTARSGVGVNEMSLFPARCEHHLRLVDDQWRIQLKRVLLLNRDHALPSLPFIL